MDQDKREMVVNPEREEPAAELAAKLAIEAREPGRAEDLPDAARDAVADGADVVAAVGGDGTQRTVAEAVAGTDAQLAIVPAGTVNLLGRVLGVETVDDAVAAIDDGTVRRIDIGRCNGHVFVLNGSSGFDAEVIERTGPTAKRFGRAGYFTAGLIRLARARPEHCTVVVDGQQVHDGPAMTVMVMNVGQRGSADLELLPDAEPDDGVLDVVVAGPTRRSMLRAGLARLRNRTPDDRDALIGRGRRIEVTWAAEVPLQCDGDLIDRGTSAVYTVDPGVLAVRVPAT